MKQMEKYLLMNADLWPPQGKFVTANIIVRTDYLKENPDVIKKLLEAHVNETLWINNHLNEITTILQLKIIAIL